MPCFILYGSGLSSSGAGVPALPSKQQGGPWAAVAAAKSKAGGFGGGGGGGGQAHGSDSQAHGGDGGDDLTDDLAERYLAEFQVTG